MSKERIFGIVIAAGSAGLVAWQASNGNWIVAAVSVLGVLGGLFPVAAIPAKVPK